MPRQPGDAPPTSEERAYGEGHKAGMELERGYRTKRQHKEVSSARRGGARTGRAQGRKAGRAEGLELGTARGQRAGAKAQLDKMSQALGREISSSDPAATFATERRKAYRAGASDAAARQSAAASKVQRQTNQISRGFQMPTKGVTPYSQQVNAPSFSPGLGGGMDHQRAAMIVVGLTAASAVGVLISDAKNSAPTKIGLVTGNGVVPIPNHLRNLTGVLLVGVLALVGAEINPWLGVIMAGAMTIDVYVTLTTDPTGKGSGGLLGGLLGGLNNSQNIVDLSKVDLSGPNANLMGPTTAGGGGPANPPGVNNERDLLNWILANPGKTPHPNAGSSDFYNYLAKNPQMVKNLLAKNP